MSSLGFFSCATLKPTKSHYQVKDHQTNKKGPNLYLKKKGFTSPLVATRASLAVSMCSNLRCLDSGSPGSRGPTYKLDVAVVNLSTIINFMVALGILHHFSIARFTLHKYVRKTPAASYDLINYYLALAWSVLLVQLPCSP